MIRVKIAVDPEHVARPPNRWMELTVKASLPLQRKEQRERHFCLQLIQDVRRHVHRTVALKGEER